MIFVTAVLSMFANMVDSTAESVIPPLTKPWEDSKSLQGLRTAHTEMRGFELLLLAQGALEVVKQQTLAALSRRRTWQQVVKLEEVLKKDEDETKAKLGQVELKQTPVSKSKDSPEAQSQTAVTGQGDAD